MVTEPVLKKLLGRLRHRWKNIFKWVLQKPWIYLVQNMGQWLALANTEINLWVLLKEGIS